MDLFAYSRLRDDHSYNVLSNDTKILAWLFLDILTTAAIVMVAITKEVRQKYTISTKNLFQAVLLAVPLFILPSAC